MPEHRPLRFLGLPRRALLGASVRLLKGIGMVYIHTFKDIYTIRLCIYIYIYRGHLCRTTANNESETWEGILQCTNLTKKPLVLNPQFNIVGSRVRIRFTKKSSSYMTSFADNAVVESLSSGPMQCLQRNPRESLLRTCSGFGRLLRGKSRTPFCFFCASLLRRGHLPYRNPNLQIRPHVGSLHPCFLPA